MARKSNKAYGTKLELKCRHTLEKVGYMVTRSTASLGVYDLIAIHPTKGTYCVQVKSGLWSSIKKALKNEWLNVNHPLPPYHQAIFVAWVTPIKGMKRKDSGWYYYMPTHQVPKIGSVYGQTYTVRGSFVKGLPWIN